MQLLTSVQVDGKPVHIQFTGSFRRPFIRRGTFQTSDPKLIDAIEKSGGYGVDYKRISPTDEQLKAMKRAEENAVIDEEGIELTVVDDKGKVDEYLKEHQTSDDDGYKLAKGITSGQKAKAYLLKEFTDQVKSSELRTNDAIREVAEKMKVRFPDWIES